MNINSLVMKTGSLILFLLFTGTTLLSCRTQKEVVTEQPPQPLEDDSDEERLVGVIDITEECGALIRVVQGDVERTYIPVNLEDKYKKDDMKVRFSYQPADVKQTGDCVFYTPITITDITFLR